MSALALVGTALTLAACSSGSAAPSGSSSKATSASSNGGSSSRSSSSGSDSVTIKNFSYSPSHLTVAPGATVTVTNKDSVVHTLTSTTKLFNTGDIQSGQSKTFTAPKKPGSYPFFCLIHQYMSGTLTVS